MVAASMLQRGEDLRRVAAVTGIPQSVVALIQVELMTRYARESHPDEPGPRSECGLEELLGVVGAVQVRRERARRRRRLFKWVVLIEVAVGVNLAAGVASLLQHNAAIGLVSAGASVALLLTVAALARRITGQRSGDRRSAP
ncbi:hypothetical protein GCM10023065_20880 [Microbacterium laevaniformans]|nr:hypothetical protein GCM10017578_13200 [Microbacterium laevaniformans]